MGPTVTAFTMSNGFPKSKACWGEAFRRAAWELGLPEDARRKWEADRRAHEN